MYKYFILLILIPFTTSSQRVDLDVFAGVANYQGDLQAQFFSFKNNGAAIAFMIKYGINEKIYIRGGIAFAKVSGYDTDNNKKNVPRNLDFSTALQEVTLGLEYRFISPQTLRFTPYVFAGGGIFHFNPYTNYNNEKVYLQPLSTEGQGLSNYPGRKPYNLTQFCVPYGIGAKWQVNCNLNVGLQLRQTKTFTDYLDDVSTNYVDQAALLAAKGPLAVALAWRGDEVNGRPYPADGTQRGNPGQGDLYYYAGVTVGLRLTDCQDGTFSLGGLGKLFSVRGSGDTKRILKQVGCSKL